MSNNLNDPKTLVECNQTYCDNCRYRILIYNNNMQYRRCHKRDELSRVNAGNK